MKPIPTYLLPCVFAVATLSAQTTPASSPSVGTQQEESAVVMNPFQVTTSGDIGYKAASSVSATRIDTPIANLPFAISAITPEFMKDTNAVSLYDAVRYSAGVSSGARGFNSGSDAFNIRGFTQAPQRDGFLESDRGNTYVDTVNLERVEIVKGPASLLYGQIAPGGTANYITKRPVTRSFAIVSLAGGSYDYLRSTADINQPLVSDKLLFRINASWNNELQYVEHSESKTTVVAPVATWNITPTSMLRVSYQWLHREETPPANLLPLVSIATPLSVVRSFDGSLGYPSGAAALVNQGGPDLAAGFRNSSDPGYLNRWAGFSRNFNQSSLNDYRNTDLRSLHTELSAKIGDRWNARAGMSYNHSDNDQFQTGVANSLFVAPPNSLVFSNGIWSVAPSWNALTAAQQLAANLDLARQVLKTPSLAVAAQNGTPGPAVHVRRPRWQRAGTKNTNFQADLTGNYQLPWGTVKPLAGLLYASNDLTDLIIQSNGTLAAPNFRTWDVNPASPTYYINPNTSNSLTTTPILNTNTLQTGTDQAAYAVLNGSFLNDRLQAVAGLRYNRSTIEVTDYRVSSTPGINSKFSKTIPQFGAGYKISKGILVYGSYSQSYALPGQPVLRGIATDANGLPQQVFLRQAVPVRGEGYDLGMKTDLYEGKFSSTLSLYEITQRDVVLTVGQQILGNSFNTDSQDNAVRAQGVELEFIFTPTVNWQIFGSVAQEDIRNRKEPVGMAYYLGAHPWLSVKTLGNLWARYSATSGKLKGLWAGAGFNYVGPKALDPRNVDLFMPSYTLWNASIGYDWKWGKTKLRAQLNGQNLTNADYQPSGATVGMPRRAVFSLTTEF